MGSKPNQKTTVEERVALLLGEGSSTPCEDNEDMNEVIDVPEWYDEEKFKRGQQFFQDYMYGLLLSKLCGLLSVLAIPSILKILIYTNMSSTPLSAYKRYVATIMHMYIWYDKDFKPGSKLWKSITEVRSKHNSASRKSCKAGLGQISQKDMVLTQFGFMGYVMAKPKLMGVYNATEYEYECFLHVWRVVGHLLGIEDRFNICSGTVEETRQCCKLIIKDAYAPALLNIDKDFVVMARALIDGLWCLNPGLEYPGFMLYIYKLCDISSTDNNNKETIIKPTNYTGFILWLLSFELYLYKFYIFRIFMNWQERMSMWLIENFPFLAYYRFGYKNSHVKILQKEKL